MKKIRSDAKLLNLPAELRHELFELLRTGTGYEAARIWLRDEHGVATSTGALNHFWEVTVKKWNQDRMLKAVAAANEIETTAAENMPLLNRAARSALSQAAFQAALANDANSAKKFMGLVIKLQDQELQRDSFELAKDKFEFNAAKAALAHAAELKTIASDNGLNEDERISAVRRALFGVLPGDEADG